MRRIVLVLLIVPAVGFPRPSVAAEGSPGAIDNSDRIKPYVVYFTDGGSVGLDLTQVGGRFQLKWIEIGTGQWSGQEAFRAGRVVTLRAPAKGGWVAVITKQ